MYLFTLQSPVHLIDLPLMALDDLPTKSENLRVFQSRIIAHQDRSGVMRDHRGECLTVTSKSPTRVVLKTARLWQPSRFRFLFANFTCDFSTYRTISFPRSMFIPHANVNSPDSSGVNSIGVVLKAGRSRAIPKSPKTTCSLHDDVSSR